MELAPVLPVKAPRRPPQHLLCSSEGKGSQERPQTLRASSRANAWPMAVTLRHHSLSLRWAEIKNDCVVETRCYFLLFFNLLFLSVSFFGLSFFLFRF